jgi:PEP-CTERM motif
MKDRVLRFTLLVAAAVLAANATAMADYTVTFNTNNSAPFTDVQAVISGVDFAGPFTGLSCGWTSSGGGQSVEMSGPSSCGNFDFTASFTGSQSTPFTIDWTIWNGSTLDPWPDSGLTTWNGSSWSSSAVPEPSTVFLVALGLLGVGLGRRRLRYR